MRKDSPLTDDPPDDFTDDAAAPARADDPAASMPNAASPRGIRRQIRRKETADEKSRRFWETMLADPVGRTEVWGLLEAAGWRAQAFEVTPTGFPSVEATWFKAGQREYGLWLYHKLSAIAPDGVRLMIEEHDPRFVKPKAKR